MDQDEEDNNQIDDNVNNSTNNINNNSAIEDDDNDSFASGQWYSYTFIYDREWIAYVNSLSSSQISIFRSDNLLTVDRHITNGNKEVAQVNDSDADRATQDTKKYPLFSQNSFTLHQTIHLPDQSAFPVHGTWCKHYLGDKYILPIRQSDVLAIATSKCEVVLYQSDISRCNSPLSFHWDPFLIISTPGAVKSVSLSPGDGRFLLCSGENLSLWRAEYKTKSNQESTSSRNIQGAIIECRPYQISSQTSFYKTKNQTRETNHTPTCYHRVWTTNHHGCDGAGVIQSDFSPDGRLFASLTKNSPLVRIWYLKSGPSGLFSCRILSTQHIIKRFEWRPRPGFASPLFSDPPNSNESLPRYAKMMSSIAPQTIIAMCENLDIILFQETDPLEDFDFIPTATLKLPLLPSSSEMYLFASFVQHIFQYEGLHWAIPRLDETNADNIPAWGEMEDGHGHKLSTQCYSDVRMRIGSLPHANSIEANRDWIAGVVVCIQDQDTNATSKSRSLSLSRDANKVLSVRTLVWAVEGLSESPRRSPQYEVWGQTDELVMYPRYQISNESENTPEIALQIENRLLFYQSLSHSSNKSFSSPILARSCLNIPAINGKVEFAFPTFDSLVANNPPRKLAILMNPAPIKSEKFNSVWDVFSTFERGGMPLSSINSDGALLSKYPGSISKVYLSHVDHETHIISTLANHSDSCDLVTSLDSNGDIAVWRTPYANSSNLELLDLLPNIERIDDFGNKLHPIMAFAFFFKSEGDYTLLDNIGLIIAYSSGHLYFARRDPHAGWNTIEESMQRVVPIPPSTKARLARSSSLRNTSEAVKDAEEWIFIGSNRNCVVAILPTSIYYWKLQDDHITMFSKVIQVRTNHQITAACINYDHKNDFATVSDNGTFTLWQYLSTNGKDELSPFLSINLFARSRALASKGMPSPINNDRSIISVSVSPGARHIAASFIPSGRVFVYDLEELLCQSRSIAALESTAMKNSLISFDDDAETSSAMKKSNPLRTVTWVEYRDKNYTKCAFNTYCLIIRTSFTSKTIAHLMDSRFTEYISTFSLTNDSSHFKMISSTKLPKQRKIDSSAETLYDIIPHAKYGLHTIGNGDKIVFTIGSKIHFLSSWISNTPNYIVKRKQDIVKFFRKIRDQDITDSQVHFNSLLSNEISAKNHDSFLHLEMYLALPVYHPDVILEDVRTGTIDRARRSLVYLNQYLLPAFDSKFEGEGEIMEKFLAPTAEGSEATTKKLIHLPPLPLTELLLPGNDNKDIFGVVVSGTSKAPGQGKISAALFSAGKKFEFDDDLGDLDLDFVASTANARASSAVPMRSEAACLFQPISATFLKLQTETESKPEIKDEEIDDEPEDQKMEPKLHLDDVKKSPCSGLLKWLLKRGVYGLSEQEQSKLEVAVKTYSWLGVGLLPSSSGSLKSKGFDYWGIRFSLSAIISRLTGTEMKTCDICWALHSEAQSAIVSEFLLNGSPTWADARALGVGFWCRSHATAKQIAERLAKSQYVKSEQDPFACALFYMALGKKDEVANLIKRSKSNLRVAELLQNDFNEPRWKKAASANAFALISKRRFEDAVTFFILGGAYQEAFNICIKNLKDIQLALFLARIIEGDDGPLFTDLVRNVVIPLALHAQDRWLHSISCTLLGQLREPLTVLDPPLFDSTFEFDSTTNLPENSYSSPVSKATVSDLGNSFRSFNYTSPKDSNDQSSPAATAHSLLSQPYSSPTKANDTAMGLFSNGILSNNNIYRTSSDTDDVLKQSVSSPETDYSLPTRPMSSVTLGVQAMDIRRSNTSAPSSPLGGNIVTPNAAVLDDIIAVGIPKFTIEFDPIEPLFISHYVQSQSAQFTFNEKPKLDSMLQRSLLRAALFYEDQGMPIIALEKLNEISTLAASTTSSYDDPKTSATDSKVLEDIRLRICVNAILPYVFSASKAIMSEYESTEIKKDEESALADYGKRQTSINIDWKSLEENVKSLEGFAKLDKGRLEKELLQRLISSRLDFAYITVCKSIYMRDKDDETFYENMNELTTRLTTDLIEALQDYRSGIALDGINIQESPFETQYPFPVRRITAFAAALLFSLQEIINLEKIKEKPKILPKLVEIFFVGMTGILIGSLATDQSSLYLSALGLVSEVKSNTDNIFNLLPNSKPFIKCCLDFSRNWIDHEEITLSIPEKLTKADLTTTHTLSCIITAFRNSPLLSEWSLAFCAHLVRYLASKYYLEQLDIFIQTNTKNGNCHQIRSCYAVLVVLVKRMLSDVHSCFPPDLSNSDEQQPQSQNDTNDQSKSLAPTHTLSRSISSPATIANSLLDPFRMLMTSKEIFPNADDQKLWNFLSGYEYLREVVMEASGMVRYEKYNGFFFPHLSFNPNAGVADLQDPGDRTLMSRSYFTLYNRPGEFLSSVLVVPCRPEYFILGSEHGIKEINIKSSLLFRKRSEDKRELLDQEFDNWEKCYSRFREQERVYQINKGQQSQDVKSVFGDQSNQVSYHAGFDAIVNSVGTRAAPLKQLKNEGDDIFSVPIASIHGLNSFSHFLSLGHRRLRLSLRSLSPIEYPVDINNPATKLDAHPSLPYYVSGTQDGSVNLWKCGSSRPVVHYSCPDHTGWKSSQVTNVRISPDGHKLGACDAAGQVVLWPIESANSDSITPYAGLVCHSKRANDLCFLNSGTFVATVGLSSTHSNLSGDLCLWDTLLPPRACCVASIDCAGSFNTSSVLMNSSFQSLGISQQSIAYSEANQQIIVGSSNGRISIFDIRQRRLLPPSYTSGGNVKDNIQLYHHQKGIASIKIDPVNNCRFATASSDGSVKLWSIIAGRVTELGVAKNIHQSQSYVNQSNAESIISTYGVTDLTFTERAIITSGVDGTIKYIPTSIGIY